MLPYFLSRNTIEIPYMMIMPLIFILMFYWMVGFASTFEQFILFYMVVVLINLVGNSIGLLLGSVITDSKSLADGVTLAILPFVLFSGFFKNTGNIPKWIHWVQYISPIKFGFAALCENEVRYRASKIDSMNFDVNFW